LGLAMICQQSHVNVMDITHSQITEKWKEVTQIVQAEDTCIGHDHETLKNKVKSLLSWVQCIMVLLFIYSWLVANNVLQGCTTRKWERLQWHMKQIRPGIFGLNIWQI